MNPRSGVALIAFCLVGCGAPMDQPSRTREPQPGDPQFLRDAALDVDNVSQSRGTRSHNLGQNCLTCHQALGPGRGRFAVAGTVFEKGGQPALNPVLELWQGPMGRGGTLVASIQGDALGNFYTTAEQGLAEKPLFPVIRLGTRSVAMPFPTPSGACNLCQSAGARLELPAP